MSVWMLLVAYCFSVGAAAYAVLSCHCLERERGEVHICCRGCDIHTECDSHSVSFKAVCLRGGSLQGIGAIYFRIVVPMGARYEGHDRRSSGHIGSGDDGASVRFRSLGDGF